MKIGLKGKIRESGCFAGMSEISRILVENLKMECEKEENDDIKNDLIILAKFYSQVDSDSAQIIFGEKIDSDPDEKIIEMVEKSIKKLIFFFFFFLLCYLLLIIVNIIPKSL